jgi:PhnB protein
MQVNPYLTFDGKCEEAFKAYQKILGGELVAMIPHEGTPAAEHTCPRNGARRSFMLVLSWTACP